MILSLCFKIKFPVTETQLFLDGRENFELWTFIQAGFREWNDLNLCQVSMLNCKNKVYDSLNKLCVWMKLYKWVTNDKTHFIQSTKQSENIFFFLLTFTRPVLASLA